MATRRPGRRLGRPDDIANAVSFLIGDSLITGTVLHAEGAQLLVWHPSLLRYPLYRLTVYRETK